MIEKLQIKGLEKLLNSDVIKNIYPIVDKIEVHNSNKPLDVLEDTLHLNIYLNQPIFGDINSFLVEKGFEFIDFINLCRWEQFTYNSVGQLVFGDALFLKSPEHVVNSMNKNDIKKYLAILYIYNRFDLIEKVARQNEYASRLLSKAIVAEQEYLTATPNNVFAKFRNQPLQPKTISEPTTNFGFRAKQIAMEESDFYPFAKSQEKRANTLLALKYLDANKV